MRSKQSFLYSFGFESPAERISNDQYGTDFESSWAVWIMAESADDALTWGKQISEEFLRELYNRVGILEYSWAGGDFAHWISSEPSELERARLEPTIPSVLAGQMPDFSWALTQWTA